MEISHLERPVGYHYLTVKITKERYGVQEGGFVEENSIVDGEISEVYIVKGYKFEEKIALNRCMPSSKDDVFLATSGIFMLYEKYHTLNQLTFTTSDESGKPLEFSGEKIAEELQRKNQNLSLYQAFLLIVLTKNLKMFYLNLDQYLIMKEQDKDSELTKLTVYDKIYGQQSFLMCSKMIPLTQK